MNIQVKSIKVVIGKKEIELSIDEGKLLHSELGKIFKVEVVEHHHHHHNNWNNYPWITYSSDNTIDLTKFSGVSTTHGELTVK